MILHKSTISYRRKLINKEIFSISHLDLITGYLHRFVKIIDFNFHRYLKENDKLALLLDFDGTLAKLVSHPSLSKMDPDSELALRSLTNNPNVYVAIISGRSADDAREIARIENITYAGNHGLEIVFVNKPRYNHELDEETRRKYVKMVDELERTVSMTVTNNFSQFNAMQ